MTTTKPQVGGSEHGAGAHGTTTGARYLYYPGCSLHSTAEEYNDSTIALLAALGIGVEELSDWNCCGATPAHATSEFLTSALPLRNLILAEAQVAGDAGPEEGPAGGAKLGSAPVAAAGPSTLIVPCAACYSAFRLAEHEVREGGERGREVNQEMAEIMGRPFRGRVTARHPLELLSERETAAGLRRMVKRPLKGLRVACYYGCLLARPSKVVAFEDPEHPMSMDNMMVALGAEPVRWSYKTDCCGQSMAVAESPLVKELTNKVARAAREAGAHALVTACPLCMMNLDSRQVLAAGEEPLPVFFYTELAALALEVGKPEAWFKRHLVDVKPALRALEAKQSA